MPRTNQAPVKVICLGLSRTGTSSLGEALTMLGFGPCYHTFDLFKVGRSDISTWIKISDGVGTADDLDKIFEGYSSALDSPPALFPAELYAAYPDAKFILTTRDPAKWEKSMRDTMFRLFTALREVKDKGPLQESYVTWWETYLLEKYHRGRLFTHTQQELLDHNERVKQIIPQEQLLVYQVGEGWDRLVKFLGVSQPTTTFPHINDTAQFQAALQALGVENLMDPPA